MLPTLIFVVKSKKKMEINKDFNANSSFFFQNHWVMKKLYIAKKREHDNKINKINRIVFSYRLMKLNCYTFAVQNSEN